MFDEESFAKELYTAYCAAVGGVAFNGEPLPDADTFFADTKKQRQIEGWKAVALRALAICKAA